MMELAVALALIAGGLLLIGASNSPVRTIIGVEVVILGGIFGAALSGDLSLAAVAAAMGVAETLLLVAATYKLAKKGHV
ncbi:MAG: ferredoxin:quinone oxidoreductase [Thermoproteus sp.]